MRREDLKILLIQLRKDPAMIAQEQQCILRSGCLNRGQLTIVNVVDQPLTAQHLEGHHAIIVGASGDFSVFDNVPYKDVIAEIMKKARRERIPVLGSCWGGQFLALVYGGEVITDKEHEEVGTYLMELTADGKRNPLFQGFPSTFWGQVGHHEQVSKLPDGAVTLVKSELCPIQVFTWPGEPIYGMQLHPELNKKEILERIEHYRDGYAADPGAFNKIIASLKESPYSENLVGVFIDKIVMPRYLLS